MLSLEQGIGTQVEIGTDFEVLFKLSVNQSLQDLGDFNSDTSHPDRTPLLSVQVIQQEKGTVDTQKQRVEEVVRLAEIAFFGGGCYIYYSAGARAPRTSTKWIRHSFSTTGPNKYRLVWNKNGYYSFYQGNTLIGVGKSDPGFDKYDE